MPHLLIKGKLHPAGLALLEGRSPKSRQRSFLQELSASYRATAGDLAFAQTHFRGTTVLLFLHQLVARAHNQIYRARAALQFDVRFRSARIRGWNHPVAAPVRARPIHVSIASL